MNKFYIIAPPSLSRLANAVELLHFDFELHQLARLQQIIKTIGKENQRDYLTIDEFTQAVMIVNHK